MDINPEMTNAGRPVRSGQADAARTSGEHPMCPSTSHPVCRRACPASRRSVSLGSTRDGNIPKRNNANGGMGSRNHIALRTTAGLTSRALRISVSVRPVSTILGSNFSPESLILLLRSPPRFGNSPRSCAFSISSASRHLDDQRIAHRLPCPECSQSSCARLNKFLLMQASFRVGLSSFTRSSVAKLSLH